MGAARFWEEGVRFECQGTGRCCVSRGGYGYVYLTLEDRRRLAAHLGMRASAFTRKHCARTDGWYHLRETGPACPYLDGKRCSVYEARPSQCRTWPFWPENMTPKAWQAEVASFCPGVGKGRLVPREEIEALLRQDPLADEG
jgi:uncharacterized protein